MIISTAHKAIATSIRYTHSNCWPAPVSKHNTDYYNSSPQLAALPPGLSSWMHSIPDQKLIYELSIPGTHDSGSYCMPEQVIDEDEPLPINIRYEAQCQSWSIRNQLRAGVRYLDLRVALHNGVPYLYHGDIELPDNQFLNLYYDPYEKVADEITSFLRQNPSEFLIISYQGKIQDPGLLVTKDSFQLIREVPRVGNLRGKAWMLQGYGVSLRDTFVLHGDRKGDVENPFRNEYYYIQNEFQINQHFSLADKVEAVLATAFLKNKPKMKFNFLSAAGKLTLPELLFPVPYEVAKDPKGPNAAMYEELGRRQRTAVPLGVTAMDFPSLKLIERIIRWNQTK